MENVPAHLWIAACAYRLQRQWPTVDPEILEEFASDLWADPRLRAQEPGLAALDWLKTAAEVEWGL